MTSSSHSRRILEQSEANLLLFWLLKDFGWVLVIPPFCLPALSVAVVFSSYLLCIHWVTGERLEIVHTLIEFLWLVGNGIWLFSEMLFDDSDPHLPWRLKPLAGAHPFNYLTGTRYATVSLSMGLALYVTWYLYLFVQHCRGASEWASETLVWGWIPEKSYPRFFIGFWICKDLIWLHEHFRLGLVCGIIALVLVADATRRNWDNLTMRCILIVEILWIFANIGWLTEEVPLHESMFPTRLAVAAVLLFSIALMVPFSSLPWLLPLEPPAHQVIADKMGENGETEPLMGHGGKTNTP